MSKYVQLSSCSTAYVHSASTAPVQFTPAERQAPQQVISSKPLSPLSWALTSTHSIDNHDSWAVLISAVGAPQYWVHLALHPNAQPAQMDPMYQPDSRGRLPTTWTPILCPVQHNVVARVCTPSSPLGVFPNFTSNDTRLLDHHPTNPPRRAAGGPGASVARTYHGRRHIAIVI